MKIKNGMTCFAVCLFTLTLAVSCSMDKNPPDLVPVTPAEAPNYWCTWYWQNYLMNEEEKVTNPDAKTVYTNRAAREQVNEKTLFEDPKSFEKDLPENIRLYAQDLLADQATDITQEVSINNNTLVIPGELIHKIGTSANSKGDISVPGLVLKAISASR